MAIDKKKLNELKESIILNEESTVAAVKQLKTEHGNGILKYKAMEDNTNVVIKIEINQVLKKSSFSEGMNPTMMFKDLVDVIEKTIMKKLNAGPTMQPSFNNNDQEQSDDITT